MKPFAIVVVLLSVAAFADTGSTYEKGTLTKQAGQIGSYELDGVSRTVWIKACGDFRTGQAIEFRIAGDKAYIRRGDGGEYKCSITMRAVPTTGRNAPPIYQRGTILGYAIRRDTDVSGGANTWTSTWTRRAKLYELRGPDLVYQVDYCGAFQAGKFTPGQQVEFRVNETEERVYIRHDVKKEYSCQLEGTRLSRAATLTVPDAPSAKAEAAENPGK